MSKKNKRLDFNEGIQYSNVANTFMSLIESILRQIRMFQRINLVVLILLIIV